MKQNRIFIVEDDSVYARQLEYQLSSDEQNTVEIFSNGRDALNSMYKNPAIVTLDYSLPDISGEDVISKMLSINPQLPIIVISAQENINTAINLLNEGAYEYIVKNEGTLEYLKKVIDNIKDKIKLQQEVTQLKDQITNKYRFENLIGQSEAMNNVYRIINKAIVTNINISLHGEIGVGKEVIAKTIHYNSDRKDYPFISVDLRSIRTENFAKDLFGTENSTDPNKKIEIGHLERANRGTIYLDGFEDLERQSQFLLQKVLQSKENFRVGADSPQSLDIRIIMSYDGTLHELITSQKIVEKHYYKTMGIPLEIPPLRERGSDIILLANKFIEDFTKSNNLESVKLTQKAKNKLLNYMYPGNVQELKAVIELAIVMTNDDFIEDDEISFSASNGLSNFLFEEKTLKDYTKGIIKHFLQKYDNNVLLVADKLDVGKSTIYRMIKNKEV